MRALFGLFLGVFCASAAAEEVRLALGPALSPDGSTVAFSWRGDLWSVPAAGGVARRLTVHPGRDRDPKFSPDGKTLAFSSDRSGSEQVYRMPADGRGDPERVTAHSEGSRVGGWFPDGKALLVSGARDHFWRRAGRYFLKRLAPAASAPVLLFDAYGSMGSLAPDGRHMLVVREGTRWTRKGYVGPGAGQIWQVDTASGRFMRLSRGEHEERSPLWHKSGRSYYYVSQADGTYNLWLHDLDTDDRVQLTRFDDDGVLFPTLSTDGSTLVFRRGFDLYRMDLARGLGPTRIEITCRGDVYYPRTRRDTHVQATHVAFTDDAREIAFVAGGDIWVMDTELREPVRVTNTAAEERDPVFSPDFSQLVFVSDRGGRPDLWVARRADKKNPWWRNRRFELTRLTNDPAPEYAPRFTPDGRLAFTSLRGDLWTMAPDGTDSRILLKSWNRPSYDFSPDGKWVVYAIDDDDFNRDVWVRRTDGSGEPFNISRHPDYEDNPVWSPDGRVIAFAGQRARDESDIHLVYLRKEDDDRTKRERTLQKALDKMKGRRKPAPPGAARVGGFLKGLFGGKNKSKNSKRTAMSGKKLPEVKIDFRGIEDRIRRVSIPNAEETALIWSPDSKRIAFSATIDGTQGLFTITPPDDLKPKLLAAGASGGRWLRDGKKPIAGLLRGRPTLIPERGPPQPFAFRARQEVNLPRRNEAAFLQAWRLMRDNFYDARMNNRDWTAIRKKYQPVAAGCVSADELSQVVNMMLGELNGSHLGFAAREPQWTRPGWREAAWHFGARWDPAWPGPGLKIRDVIDRTPATRDASRLQAGEVVLKANGRDLDPATAIGIQLHGAVDKDVLLRVRGHDGKERDVSIRPVSYGVVRRRLYEHWIKGNREKVDQASGDRLGYLHIRSMNWRSFERFEAELYKVGHKKDGLLIDVRENGGGFTTDHLLTVLTQPTHAITVPRGGAAGYPQGRMVYARWNKPVTVLCNQNSFSNAEIFSHAIKTLKRGRLVGVQTAGGVISTGGRGIMGFAFLRMPFRAWFVSGSGEDMEQNGAKPDITIWPEPGEWPRGRDRQLQTAVRVLLDDVEKHKARPHPKLRFRTQRTPD